MKLLDKKIGAVTGDLSTVGMRNFRNHALAKGWLSHEDTTIKDDTFIGTIKGMDISELDEYFKSTEPEDFEGEMFMMIAIDQDSRKIFTYTAGEDGDSNCHKSAGVLEFFLAKVGIKGTIKMVNKSRDLTE